MTFAELGLHEALLSALTKSGYTEPTPVQALAIPAALRGADLLVSSQTGSGKTAAFMLPALHRFATQPRPGVAGNDTPIETPPRAPESGRKFKPSRAKDNRRFQPAQPRMLVLAPTRELAMQVTAATDKYGSALRRLKAVAILGGMPYPKQMELLSRNPEILVATPGRLIDHMESRKIDFSRLEILVLDEADRMLDMGFIEDIEKIIAATPASRQTMLFSATLEGAVGHIAQRVTRNAETIRVAGATVQHENIEQRLHFVDDLSHKNRLLDHLLRDTAINQAVVFTATKRDADGLSDRLNVAGFHAAPLHGDMPQGARNRTLNAMRRGQVRILVATDVAARGIDVPTITHVFNYDLPKFAEDYVHRIGRTGRAGRDGLAVSLANHSERHAVRKIERFTRQAIPVTVVPGHEPKRQPAEKTSTGKPRSYGKPRSGTAAPGNASGRGTGHWRDQRQGQSTKGSSNESRDRATKPGRHSGPSDKPKRTSERTYRSNATR